MVTSTNPPVGGTFSPPAPNNYQYDVNFNEPVDPTSVQTSDLTVNGTSNPSVIGVSVINGNSTARFTLHMNFGGTLNASIAAGAINDQFGNPGAAFSGSYTVGGCPPQDHYDIAQIGGSIVPGTTDTGNHCDDCVTTIALPFAYSLYDQTYNAVNLSSNGTAQFTTLDNNWGNICLPWTTHNYTILPYWDDLYTLNAGFGIFTSVTGTAPNRTFNIEWRAQYYPGSGTANFELRLYEGQTRFDVIYGSLTNGNTSASAGVQKSDTTFDQYFCNGSGAASTGGQSYTLQVCTPSPTPTATVPTSPTPTATVPPSPTPTPTIPPTPTPTPSVTPSPTPTPTAAPTPAAPTALSATNVTATSFTANWSNVSGVDGYLLDVATDNSFNNYVGVFHDLQVMGTSTPVSGLSRNTFYYYRVRAYNVSGRSPYSNVIRVKTRNR
jgi:hypothetical protein